jgi:hypothetical protein
MGKEGALIERDERAVAVRQHRHVSPAASGVVS